MQAAMFVTECGWLKVFCWHDLHTCRRVREIPSSFRHVLNAKPYWVGTISPLDRDSQKFYYFVGDSEIRRSLCSYMIFRNPLPATVRCLSRQRRLAWTECTHSNVRESDVSKFELPLYPGNLAIRRSEEALHRSIYRICYQWTSNGV